MPRRPRKLPLLFSFLLPCYRGLASDKNGLIQAPPLMVWSWSNQLISEFQFSLWSKGDNRNYDDDILLWCENKNIIMYIKCFSTVPDTWKAGNKWSIHSSPMLSPISIFWSLFPASSFTFLILSPILPNLVSWSRVWISNRRPSPWLGSGKSCQKESSSWSSMCFENFLCSYFNEGSCSFSCASGIADSAYTFLNESWNSESNLFLGTSSYLPYTKA